MVTFNQLWNNHPTNTGEQLPCRTLGFSNFENQCSIRLGVCLRRAGVPASSIRGSLTCNQAKLTGHGQDDMHYIRARELAQSLRNASIPGVGPVYTLTNPGDFANELDGRKGMIFFNGYWWRSTDTSRPTGDHIDLWNGWRTSAKMLFPWFSWLGGYNKSSNIWFWEVK